MNVTHDEALDMVGMRVRLQASPQGEKLSWRGRTAIIHTVTLHADYGRGTGWQFDLVTEDTGEKLFCVHPSWFEPDPLIDF